MRCISTIALRPTSVFCAPGSRYHDLAFRMMKSSFGIEYGFPIWVETLHREHRSGAGQHERGARRGSRAVGDERVQPSALPVHNLALVECSGLLGAVLGQDCERFPVLLGERGSGVRAQLKMSRRTRFKSVAILIAMPLNWYVLSSSNRSAGSRVISGRVGSQRGATNQQAGSTGTAGGTLGRSRST